MKDQKQLWDEAHKEHALLTHSTQQTTFAEQCLAQVPPQATLLELGCGEGNDSIFFAEKGLSVIATDFSSEAIKQNQVRYNNANLQFCVQDISQNLAFADNQFDAVYARLSLHYFTDIVTRQIFEELARVLKPGGTLCFMCKTVDDRLYGKGDLIEKDMYELDGHVRHFFSEPYTRDLLAKNFTVSSIEVGQEELYGKVSGFIKVIAAKE